MPELDENKSESEVSSRSSTSSWSVLEEDSKILDEKIKIEPILPEFPITTIATRDQVEDVTPDLPPTPSKTPIITQDKYFEPQQVFQVYENRKSFENWEYDDRVETWEKMMDLKLKPKIKRRKRPKFTFQTFKLVGALITIAGLAMACFIMPKTTGNKSIQLPSRYGPENKQHDLPEIKITPPKNTNLQELIENTKLLRGETPPISKTINKPKITQETIIKNDEKKDAIKTNTVKTTKNKDPPTNVCKNTFATKKGLMNELTTITNRIKNRIPKLKIFKGLKEAGISTQYLKLGIFLALHFVNDLVMLRLVSQIRRNYDLKLKMKKEKSKIKKSRKFLKINTLITQSDPDLNCVVYYKKTIKNAGSDENRKERKHLFKELPFTHHRVPKPKITTKRTSLISDIDSSSTDLRSFSKSCKDKHGFLIHYFVHELNNIEVGKSTILKELSFNQKTRREEKEKEELKNDAVKLKGYVSFIKNEDLREELLKCILYLKAKRRDYMMLMRHDNTCRYQDALPLFIRQSLFYETAIADLFEYKDTVDEDCASSEYDCAKILVKKILREFKFEVSNVKDAATGRYVVPIKSLPDISVVKCEDSKVSWPINTTSDGEGNANENKEVEKVADKKASFLKFEVIKDWKDKYEQLKLFWKSRQEYYEKRVEICDLIRSIIPKETVSGDKGVNILDRLIHEVIARQEVAGSGKVDLIGNVVRDIKTIYRRKSAEESDVSKICKVNDEVEVLESRRRNICNNDGCGCSKYPRIYWETVCKKSNSGKRNFDKN